MDGRRTLGLFAALAALASAAPATAAERPPRPDEVSAVDVYREQLPTSSGPRASTGPDGSPPHALPAEVASALRSSGLPDAAVLERVATSPGYGAPSRALPDVPSSEASSSAALGAVPAAVEVAAEARAGRASALLVALAVVTAVLVVAARRRSDPS